MKRLHRDIAIAALLSVVLVVLLLVLALIYLNFLTNAVKIVPGSLDSTFNVSGLSIEYMPAGKPAYIVNYSAYFATTLAQQERGYMNQTSLGDCDGRPSCIGMLFVFRNQSTVCFWMKNTEIPLKQIWIESNGSISLIYNATPYSEASVCGVGQSVLETSINSTINYSDRVTT